MHKVAKGAAIGPVRIVGAPMLTPSMTRAIDVTFKEIVLVIDHFSSADLRFL